MKCLEENVCYDMPVMKCLLGNVSCKMSVMKIHHDI